MLSSGLELGVVLGQADPLGLLPVHYALLNDQPDLVVMLVFARYCMYIALIYMY